MIKVLFLSAWYPNRYDAMFGLFVQKHAEAISRFCNVHVLYVHGDNSVKNIEVIDNQNNNLKETIVYYPINKNRFSKFNNFFAFFFAFYVGLKHINIQKNKPEIIHVNILTRTGVIAYLVSTWLRIPYIITEHWSRYILDKTFTNVLHKWLTQVIVKKASAVITVSEILKNGMLKNGLINPNYKIIYNVVDDNFLAELSTVLQSKIRILHISCFDEKAKNIKGIVRVSDRLAKIREDFELVIIGTGKDFNEIIEYAKKFKFPNKSIQFLGEKSPEEVADWFRSSDVFVLFSNYETAGVVIAESLACGVPVISTKVGIATEVIDTTNGILVDAKDEDALFEAMKYMLNNLDKYNKATIKTNHKNQFSYQNIGNEIYNLYKNIISCYKN